MHRQPPPDEWLATLIDTINRMRAAGIEPTDVMLPLMGHNYQLPDTVEGLPVMWAEQLAFPYVAVECG